MSRERIILIVVGLSLLSILPLVIAQDNGPTAAETITNLSSSRFNESLTAISNQEAQAGNITELEIFGVSATETWAGFYGNVTGAITLEDAQGNIFYNWSDAEPKGRVYASNSSTVAWENIHCFNYTGDGATEINESIIEAAFNIDHSAVDGLNETFGDGTIPGTTGGYSPDGGSNHPGFFIGTVQIVAGTCPATTTYQSSRRSADDFVELMLTDNSTIVFATIIEQDIANNHTDVIGFDGLPHDFQIMVLDDGHDGDTAVTEWFFWLELE